MAKNLKKTRLQKKTSNFSKSTWLLAGITLIFLALFLSPNSLIENWKTAMAKPSAPALNNTPVTPTSEPLVSDIPVSISVPSASISLKVIPAYYNSSNNSWTLSLNDAHWAVGTAKPNNKSGLTFIYAHNRAKVFSALPKVKPGELATITTENGHTFTYRLVNTSVVSPTETSFLDYTGKPILVLQTCTGLWFQNRQLFFFDLVEAN